MCRTHGNALYKGIPVVLADYDKIKNFILDRVAAQPPRPLSGAKSQRSELATPLYRSSFLVFSGSPARSASGPRAGALRAPWAPSGPKGPWGPWGLFRSHFEWIAITNG